MTGLSSAYLNTASNSFVEFARTVAPHVLPSGDLPVSDSIAPHATTIVALTTADGVLMAGDRRATIGSLIASRTMEKVHRADDASVVGIAGTAGIALELVRLFQLELEHYEKIEGTVLSLDGKANRLASMLRANLGFALRGLAVVPLFAGVDQKAEGETPGRIFSFDVTGGRYEEQDYHSVGSGSTFARGSLKKRWKPGLSEEAAVEVAVEALFDAADDDSGTAGPDLIRRIGPTMTVVDSAGAREVETDFILAAAAEVAARRGGGSA